MKKIIIVLFMILNFSYLWSGDVLPGSVPGSIVYQGRIEKNNAPLNGIVHINFRIYGSLTGSDMLWESGYQTAEARAGVFSITLTPPINIFTQGSQRYIEVEVEGERLTPREPINSVIYSMVAKKLEDGSSVRFSSAIIGTVLQSYPGYSDQKLIVYGGGIYTDQICFYPTGNCMGGVGEATVPSTLYSSGTVRIRADIDNDLLGDIIFETRGPNEIARFLNNGNFGIGTTNPTEKLYVNGNAYVSNNLIAGNNIIYSGILNNGIIKGGNSEQISIGVINDRIDFLINNSTNISINGSRLGIGTTNPSYSLDVNGDMRGNSLYISDINLSNEIRNTSGNINFQTSSIYNVGIGTNTPTEKLHVAGTIRADEGIYTSSATFTSDVNVLGNLSVTKYGKKIELSSTTVYGRLNVVGEFLVNQDKIAALASTQTYSGINTFISKTYMTSHVYVSDGIMVYGANTEGFGGGKYFQIGNPLSVSENAVVYISGGNNASSSLNFYRGASNKIASLSASSNIFRLTYSNSDDLRFYIDSSSTVIYGPLISFSTSTTSTPIIYINSQGNTGIGTDAPDEKLVVNGNIRLVGTGSYIKFSDGSILTSSSAISVGAISNTGDAVIYADSDNNGTGAIVMRTNNATAMVITNSAKVGLGILNPQEKLHIIGDVILGNTANPYSGDSNSDLIVGGNLVVDGYFKQRSSIPAEFESLYVRGDVFLSTGATSKTGIGTLNPFYRLDVDGDVNLTGNLRINGTSVITSARALTNLTGITSSGNINFSGNVNLGNLTALRLVATDGSKNLVSSITSADLRSSVTGTTGTGNLVFATTPTFNTGIIVSGWGDFSQGITASSGTFTNIGDYSITTSSGILVGSILTINSLTPSKLVATDGSKNLVSSITSADLRSSVTGTTGTGNLVFATTPTFNTGIIVSGWGNFSQGITASSGTFTNTSDYSIKTSSGIFVGAGLINMNNTRIINLAMPQLDYDAATKKYVDDSLSIGGTEPNSWLVTGNNAGSGRKIGTINSQSFDLITAGLTRISFLDSGYVNFTSNVPHTTFSSGITASSGTFGVNGLSSPIIRFTGNVYISSTTSTNYGGVYVSTHIYLPSGSIYYGNGSGLNNVNAANLSCSNCVDLGSETNGNYVADISAGSGISVSGTAGEGWTPTVSLTGQALALHNLSSTGFIVRTGAGVTTRSITAGTGISVSNGDGVSANPSISVVESALALNNIGGTLGLSKGGTGADLSSAGNGPVKKSGTSFTTANINLTSEVTGTLPIGNGGTGVTSFTPNQPIIYNGSTLTTVAGFSGSFTVAKSTDSAQGCMQLNFQYGILVSTQTVTCP